MYSLYDKNGEKRREKRMLIQSIRYRILQEEDKLCVNKKKNTTKPKFPLG